MKLALSPRTIAFLLITILGCLAYCNSFDVPFHFDDHHNIEKNPSIRIESIGSLLNAGFDNPTKRPVAYISFAVNFLLGRESVWGYHLFNLIVHLVCGGIVFELSLIVLQQLTPKECATESGVNQHRIALLASLIFVLHPVQTQSVTYIVQRMASLCAMFYLAGITFYLYGRMSDSTTKTYRWWALGVASWTLALGTKQLAVTFPFAVLLIEWILYQRGELSWLKKRARVIALLLAVCFVVAYGFKGNGLFHLFTAGYEKRSFTLVERLLTEGRVLVHYLGLVFAPLPGRLVLLYDYSISTSLFAPVSTIISWAAIVAAVVMALRLASRYRLLSLAVLWFFLHQVVESTVIPLELAYEHRLYLPIVFICLFAGSSVFHWITSRNLAMGLAVFLVGLLLLGTYTRNETWRSERKLWEDNIAKQPTAARAYFNLGLLDLESGSNKAALQRLNTAIKIQPSYHLAYVHRGILSERLRDPEAALADYDRAMSIPRLKAFAFGDYSDGYVRRASLLRRKGEFQKAIVDCTRALQFNARNPQAHFERAVALVFQNKPELAVHDFRAAIQLAPNLTAAHSRFAWFLATYPTQLSNPSEAVEHAKRACELTDWKDPNRLATLAAAHARAGQFKKSVKWQQRCIELSPDSIKQKMSERLALYQQEQPYIRNYRKPAQR